MYQFCTNCIKLRTNYKWLFKKMNLEKEKKKSETGICILRLGTKLDIVLILWYNKVWYDVQVTVFYLETYFQIWKHESQKEVQ